MLTADGSSRIFLHGWLCPPDWTNCQGEGVVPNPKRRAVYGAVLTWGDDGATPAVPTFRSPKRPR